MAEELSRWGRFVLPLVKGTLVVAWTLVLLVSLAANVEEGVWQLPASTRFNIVAVSPQAFGFFTRNPREPEMLVYRQRDQAWTPVDFRRAGPHTLFGLRRTSSRLSAEAGSFLAQIPRSGWRRCGGTLGSCLGPAEAAPDSIRNAVPRPTLCGDLIVQLRDRVPWAWSGHQDAERMASFVAQIRVDCSGPRTDPGDVS